MDDDKPAVRVQHLRKSFAGRLVLNDVSFDVTAGEAFCLLGRSGVGKSVTLKLLIRLLAPDSGKILIHGKNIADLNSAQLADVRKNMGFLFQDAALFDSMSVSDNVAFPLRRHTNKPNKEIQDIVHEKLEEVELAKEGKKCPASCLAECASASASLELWFSIPRFSS